MWKQFAEVKQAAIGQQIQTLERMNAILSELVKCECATLEDCVRFAESGLSAEQKNDHEPC